MTKTLAVLPSWISPQLASISNTVPDGPGWLHEIKLDGFRLLVRKDGDLVQFFTRNGHNWSGRFPAIAEEIRRLPCNQVWLDGELVVLRENGRSCFGSLQRAVARLDQGALSFSSFDIIHLDGRDLCRVPLERRKEALQKLVGEGAWNLRYVDHICGNGAAFFAAAVDHHLEGIISKRMGSFYHPGARSQSWIKSKWKGYKAVREVAWEWWKKAG